MIAEAGKIDFLSTGVNELEVSENMTNELSKRLLIDHLGPLKLRCIELLMTGFRVVSLEWMDEME